jgi:hypothetical protein
VSTRPQEPRVAVRNAGDVKQVKKARESERARLERERNEDVAVWNTEDGRAFTRRLLEGCGVYELSMANDSHWTAFNEGGRNVGLGLLARMTTTAPDLYALMEQEHLTRQSREPSAPEPTESSESPETEEDDAS